ncbi:hypothetical protein [Bradyrhizobium australafricanum]|uniref:hypothetical protein n=1 Tax=Bradyrhizobium australafricanum TaxID=2821406 RepID=UPI001CE360C0|nr:hypothetical protein [Bradyrhizobium australafricanum]MCA6098177.1 hypothetical protein [Bradyrhizobium australafricanum]
MRAAYEIVQRLMWDFSFRAEFHQDRKEAIAKHFPEARGEAILFGETAKLYGLEEEAYRRAAALQRTSKAIFEHSHPLILSFFGTQFFYRLLANFFARVAEDASPSIRILEPFDGYVVGPHIIEQAKELASRSNSWVLEVMSYDWAIWHAGRVVQGWPPLAKTPPLTEGGALLAFDFDVKSMLREIKRLNSCSVASDFYKERIVPGTGSEYLAIYPSDGSVAVATLDKSHYDELSRAIQDHNSPARLEVCSVLERIGLVANASFLCCSREASDEARLSGELPRVVEPQPH